ncbi:GGDEF domain-containing protein [Qipengyuania marisflavi]|uniref:diguanylate cyclase n=1 Tax=Qipengyuania marisflavi TaxID=2486356 RepID=A0A5S3P9L4_9SPHN|nr:diguanylate cyclase [Qipengyuania marisflavi]TMM50199.1 diguanylate cyclase [Qipengyuania marisflavi]
MDYPPAVPSERTDFDTYDGADLTSVADDYAVQREIVIAMLERERRALTSSLLALSLLAAAIAFLPDPLMMAGLLAARTASFLFTRHAASRLERKVKANQPLMRARGILFVAMAFTGITLGLLLVPQSHAAPPAAVAAIQLVVLVAVTLIAVTLAALPRSRDAMLVCFWLTACAIVMLTPEASTGLVAVVTMLVIGVRTYSANTGHHILSAATITVENRQLSEELAEALAHAEFLSWRDPLTGLFNRRKLFEVTQAERSVTPRYLLMIDLDKFKTINDQFGHAAGDHALIATADALRAWMDDLPRDDHLAFRLGGEEFLVIAKGLDDTSAALAAEALRFRLAAIGSEMTDYPDLQITASIGLAEWRFSEKLDDALLRADNACFEAKGRGRNQVKKAA